MKLTVSKNGELASNNEIRLIVLFRGDSFRTDFSSLGEIRSIVPESVHIMALTATASLSTGRSIIKSLNMQKPVIIYLAPEKDNKVSNQHLNH